MYSHALGSNLRTALSIEQSVDGNNSTRVLSPSSQVSDTSVRSERIQNEKRHAGEIAAGGAVSLLEAMSRVGNGYIAARP